MDIPNGIKLEGTHKDFSNKKDLECYAKDGSHIGYSLRDLVFVLTRDL